MEPAGLAFFPHNAVIRGGISFLFTGEKMTGYTHFHPSGHLQELGHPAERPNPNADECERMTQSTQADNPLHPSASVPELLAGSEVSLTS